MSARSILAVVAISAVALTGCASTHPARVASPVTEAPPFGRPAGSGTAPADANYRAALDEARRLLAEAPLPPGAARDGGSFPAALSGPVMGRPSTDHLIDVAALWTVPMSMSAAVGWLQGHPPPALSRSGSAGGLDGGIASKGYAWSAPDDDAYRQAELEVGVIPDGPQRAFLRADGVDIWISSEATPDKAAGPRLHFGPTSGCPRRLDPYTDVTNPAGPVPDRLLPADAPSSALICEYGNSPSGETLSASTPLSGPVARQLALAINAIRLGSAGAGTTSCPSDRGLVDVLAFSYSGQRDVDLWYHASGCRTLDNGAVIAVEGGNPSFYNGFMPLMARTAGG